MRFLPSLRRSTPPAEERAHDPTVPPTWASLSGGPSYAGTSVTLNTAVGLPAVAKAIFTLCEMIAQLPLNVYKGRGADKRLADQTWQYRLLAELPGMGDFTPFDLISDIVACLETNGNAFLLKVKAAGQVIALIAVDPSKVEVKRERGEKRFIVREEGGRQTEYGAGDILHIRGVTVSGSDRGLSPIALHRQKLGTIIAQDEFHGRYYGQGTNTGTVVQLESGKKLNTDQARDMRDTIVRQNSGTENAHLPLILQDGATLAKSGFSMEDSQYVESERLNLVQAAHIFRLPPKLLTGEGDLSEWDFIALYQLGLAPRLKRIELALFTDADMFPQRLIYPEFDTRPLLRTDAKTKAEVQHFQVQDGTRLKDEIRAEDGLGPLPAVPDDPTKQPGMVPLVTPVGAGANPDPPAPADVPDDDDA